jgi:hypothetical protein
LTFFSGTDLSELNDSVEAYVPGYYLSLIVNHTNDWKAKVVYLVTEPESATTFVANVQNNRETGETVALEIPYTARPRQQFMIDIDMKVEVPTSTLSHNLPVITSQVGESFLVNGQLLTIKSNNDGVITMVVDTSADELSSVTAQLEARVTYLQEQNRRKPVVPVYTGRGYQNNDYPSHGGSNTFQAPQSSRTQTNEEKGPLSHDHLNSVVAKCMMRDAAFNGTLAQALEEFMSEIDNVNKQFPKSERYTDMRHTDVSRIWEDIETTIPIVLLNEFTSSKIAEFGSRTQIINAIKGYCTQFISRNLHKWEWRPILNEFTSNDHLGMYIRHDNIQPFLISWQGTVTGDDIANAGTLAEMMGSSWD